ncbi:MAG: BBE domain-containing protein, partial [Chitinophagales bacterium]|nr:BBE domain-containing protein [Chitinophagales bacterium]
AQLYYGKNYERLQKIKQQFDPYNVFGYAQGIIGRQKIS